MQEATRQLRENAVAESCLSGLRKDCVRKRIYITRDLSRADVFNCTEVSYIRTRSHSDLGGVSPDAFGNAAA